MELEIFVDGGFYSNLRSTPPGAASGACHCFLNVSASLYPDELEAPSQRPHRSGCQVGRVLAAASWRFHHFVPRPLTLYRAGARTRALVGEFGSLGANLVAAIESVEGIKLLNGLPSRRVGWQTY